MGISGFAPFLAKLCPEAVKAYPGRLQTFLGKTIVIDGNLVSQRLHFRKDIHEQKHVLGWYRLIKEVKDAGARPIVIFDGKSRISAKQLEAERRNQVIRLTNTRGALELARLARLQRLSSVLDVCRRLDPEVQTGLTELIKKITKHKMFSLRPKDTEFLKDVASLPSHSECDGAVYTDETIQGVGDLVPPEEALPPITPVEIPAMLASLYADFRESQDAPEQEGTKHQRGLGRIEGSIWSRISDPEQGFETVESDLHEITDQSIYLSGSFQRRTSRASSLQFEENRELLHAMGVTVIDSEGVEGEALASSMVRNGLADYVASEDTDVIVFQCPLMRNIVDTSKDIIIMDGAQVRAGLEMSESSYVDFALLLGTDFTERIPLIGPHTALSLIREYESIENLLAAGTKYAPEQPLPFYLERVRVARELYHSLAPVPEKEALVERQPDEAKVEEILKRHGIYTSAVYKWGEGDALEGNGIVGTW